MSDRAYCQIEVAEAHEAQAEDIIGPYGFSNDRGGDSDGTIIFESTEADNGGNEALEALQKAALPFVGYHEEGGDYLSHAFACNGKYLVGCLALKGAPACQVNDKGKPDYVTLAKVRGYLKMKQKAEKAFKRANKGKGE